MGHVRIVGGAFLVLVVIAAAGGCKRKRTPAAGGDNARAALAATPPADAASPPTFTYTFTNKCTQPIWIGQTAAASNKQSYPPVGGNWALAPACTANSQCGTGQTCNTASAQCTCAQNSDCPGSAPCTNGLCSTTATFQMPQTWTSGTFWPRTGCTGSGTQLSCATGQCTPQGSTSGLLDCGVGITSPTNPVTQFEVSSIPTAINYDVSLVAGFNVPMKATPVGGSFVVPGTPATQPAACLYAGCSGDLSSTCPASLQVPLCQGSCRLDPNELGARAEANRWNTPRM